MKFHLKFEEELLWHLQNSYKVHKNCPPQHWKTGCFWRRLKWHLVTSCLSILPQLINCTYIDDSPKSVGPGIEPQSLWSHVLDVTYALWTPVEWRIGCGTPHLSSAPSSHNHISHHQLAAMAVFTSQRLAKPEGSVNCFTDFVNITESLRRC